ncbi:Hypothetical protein, putative [Bodo saltans]|uniref:Uncharacterized protein n=1 Tax=Bodo saltans TaxID=75058 RepID=A0A0S4J9D5_BODSA|nr:Hypothetical protein, putative [Bodo saltans]|eukprot:CUG84798.1 Hypothetical protein, putative [Bodo saltans]
MLSHLVRSRLAMVEAQQLCWAVLTTKAMRSSQDTHQYQLRRSIDCSTEKKCRSLVENLSHAIVMGHSNDMEFVRAGARALANRGYGMSWCEEVLSKCSIQKASSAFRLLTEVLPRHVTPSVIARVLRRLNAARRTDDMLYVWLALDPLTTQRVPSSTTRVFERLLLNSLPRDINPASLRKFRSDARSLMERMALDVLLAHIADGGARREALVQSLFFFQVPPAGGPADSTEGLAHCARWLSPGTVSALQDLLVKRLNLESGVACERRELVGTAKETLETSTIVLELERRCDELFANASATKSKFSCASAVDGPRTVAHASTITRHEKSLLLEIARSGDWAGALRQISTISSNDGSFPHSFGVQLCGESVFRDRSKSSWGAALHIARMHLRQRQAKNAPSSSDVLIARVAGIVADCGAWEGALMMSSGLQELCDCHVLSQVIHCLCKSRQQSLLPQTWAKWRATVGDIDAVPLQPIVLQSLLWGATHGSREYDQFVANVFLSSLSLLSLPPSGSHVETALGLFAMNKRLSDFLCSDRWPLSSEDAIQVALYADNREALCSILKLYGTPALAAQVQHFYLAAGRTTDMPSAISDLVTSLLAER